MKKDAINTRTNEKSRATREGRSGFFGIVLRQA